MWRFICGCEKAAATFFHGCEKKLREEAWIRGYVSTALKPRLNFKESCRLDYGGDTKDACMGYSYLISLNCSLIICMYFTVV